MPALPLQTDAFVLLRRAPTEAFQGFTLFSAEHGTLLVFQRVPKKSAASATAITLDLFDEVSLQLESSNQGQTWFVKEARLITRHTGLGRSYDALSHASALATLIARNTVSSESRLPVAALLRQALASIASGARADIVWLKSLYCFARDEGHPVKQQWYPTLDSSDRETAAALLNLPLADQSAEPALVDRIILRLEDYLRGHTEILLD